MLMTEQEARATKAAPTNPRAALRRPQQLTLPVQHLVGRPRAGRKLARLVMVILVLLPVLLVFVPWQQNVPGAGRVTALNPLQRIQTIPAPVSGRLVSLSVREGDVVQEGDPLAQMEDLDPEFTARLSERVELEHAKVENAQLALTAAEERLIATQDAQLAALREATAEFHASVEKVLEAENKLTAEEGNQQFAQQEFERESRLLAQGNTALRLQQQADSKLTEANGKTEAARAVVAQRRLERDAKEAKILKIDKEYQAKIKDLRAKVQEAKSKLNGANNSLLGAKSEQARQDTQEIVAKRAGTILRVFGATGADVIGRGEPLIQMVPDADQLAVEFWVRGIDAPLVRPGRTVRLQFEGWPAVQAAGWPMVAVGTFGGEIVQVDTQAAADGRVRVMVLPDPNDDPWPKERFLRQGVRANGWVQLDTVSTGYELWRRLNAFQPTVDEPNEEGGQASKGSSKLDGDQGKSKK